MRARKTLQIAAALLLLTQAAQSGISAEDPDKGPKHPGDMRIPDKLSQGDIAPDFHLKTKDGKREIALSEFKGKKPVVLIFGSYT